MRLAGLGMVLALMTGAGTASAGTVSAGAASAGIASVGTASAQTGFLDRTVTVDGVAYRYQVYVPVDYMPDREWPVALFLHGSGERGDDGTKQTNAGIGPAIRNDRKRFPLIVVMPQTRENTRWNGAMAKQAMQALDASILEFHGDPQRIYLTGMSMGGQGTWLLAAAHPHRFAAMAPICGFLRLKNDDDVVDPVADKLLVADFPELLADNPSAAMARRIGGTPAWIFHGADDDLVPVHNAQRMAAAMRAVGGEVRYSEYPGVNHGSWDRAYAEPELVSWLLSHRLDDNKTSRP
ncbi:prolyl oligopeptidase family serine peptidase [soil metagenome]